MKCSTHRTVDATASCKQCGKALCDQCRVDLESGTWCRNCLAVAVERAFILRPRWRSSKLAAALLSIIPGAGHMYLGFIGRGFALMGLLFSSIFLVILYSVSTGMYWMSAYLIPTLVVLFLSYAIFDSIGAADELRAGRGAPRIEDPIMEQVWTRILLNPRAAGYVLVIAGSVGVLDIFSRPLNRLLRESLSLDFPIVALVIPIALVVAGSLLLARARRSR